MKKNKLLVTFLSMASLFAFGAVALAGCAGGGGGGGSSEVGNYSITWSVDEHATVVVENETTLPTSYPAGEKISFSVTTENGYDVDAVRSNNKKVAARNGVYTIAITKDTTIAVTTKQSVGDITIVSRPTKLRYIAGEELDVTGMVVQVSIGTGEPQTIPYGENGYSVYPTVFAGGETSFEVSYQGKTANVNLDARVEFLVTINPNGGTISSTYLSGLQARNLNNYAVNDGVVSFTYYNNLTSAVALPVGDQITKENNSFTGWSGGVTSITNNTAANVTAVAGWQVQLVEIASVDLVVENNKPYLTLNGTFRASNSVYLFLKEGQKNITITGDTYTGNSGETFEVKFDLTKLSDKGDDYERAWMDIRFNANYNGQDESMELFVAQGFEVNENKVIAYNGIKYAFATYDGALKVYFSHSMFDFTLSVHTETVNQTLVDYLRFVGSVADSAWFGKYIGVSFYSNPISGHTAVMGGAISSTGTFDFDFDLSLLGYDGDTYAHIHIFEDSTMADTLYGGQNTNLLANDVTNEFNLREGLGNSTPMVCFKTTMAESGHSYYIGHRWEGLMIYAVDDSTHLSFDNVTLALENNKVYYVLTGECGVSFTNENFTYGFRFEHNNNADNLGWDTIYNDEELNNHAVVSNGHFTAKICVSDAFETSFKNGSDNMWGLLAKINVQSASNTKDIKPNTSSDQSFELNGVRYSILQVNNDELWNFAHLVLEKIA